MRTAVVALLCLAVVAVSAQPKGGAPLQARLARASPNQSCTASNAGANVKGSCWTKDTCDKHKGKQLPAISAATPTGKCPAGQSCCVTGLPATAPAPVKPTAPAPVKPAAPAAKAEPCAPKSASKVSSYACMQCVNTRDSNNLKCKFDLRSGKCFGSQTRYNPTEAFEYKRLLASKNTDTIGDCQRI